jgi:hypothetical protein
VHYALLGHVIDARRIFSLILRRHPARYLRSDPAPSRCRAANARVHSGAKNAQTYSPFAEAIATIILPHISASAVLTAPFGNSGLSRPCWRESSRTISARCGGVNRKMDKLTRAQLVAWGGRK